MTTTSGEPKGEVAVAAPPSEEQATAAGNGEAKAPPSANNNNHHHPPVGPTGEDKDHKWLDWYSKFDHNKPGGKTRRDWYNETTNVYRIGRPKYPNDIVDRVCTIAKLGISDGDDRNHRPPQLLELGCGPGTVTQEFIQRGYHIIAMDPSPSNVADVPGGIMCILM